MTRCVTRTSQSRGTWCELLSTWWTRTTTRPGLWIPRIPDACSSLLQLAPPCFRSPLWTKTKAKTLRSSTASSQVNAIDDVIRRYWCRARFNWKTIKKIAAKTWVILELRILSFSEPWSWMLYRRGFSELCRKISEYVGVHRASWGVPTIVFSANRLTWGWEIQRFASPLLDLRISEIVEMIRANGIVARVALRQIEWLKTTD